MSLLMDALKKAEEAKRQAEAAAAAGQTQAAAAGSDTQGLPELPPRLELLDHEFEAGPAGGREAAAPSPPPAGPPPDDRAAARNVFQAKQPAPRRTFPLVVGGLALIAAAGIGGWVWWQMQPKGGLAASPATARTPAAVPPLPAAQPAPAAAPAASPVTAAPAAASVSATPITATMPAPPRQPEAAAAAAVAPTLTSAPPTAAQPAAASVADAQGPIRITKGRLQVNPQIAAAYQAFQAGDLATARRHYEAVLKTEPKNTDALHGLAAISLRQGQPEAAEDFYLRLLEADPKDATAQAALIGLRAPLDPVQSESRLKNLLASQPESAALNFALGNLYARLGRWNEAQQAYFRAHVADSENPDYQFNLAVSLDQLHQPKLALQYYQGALAAAAQRPAAFDREQVAARINELQK